MKRSLAILVAGCAPIALVVATASTVVTTGCGAMDSMPVVPDPEAATFTPQHETVPPALTPAIEANTLIHNGNTMHIASVVAVLDPADAALRFELLPFDPTDEEVERCLKDETFFMMVGKDSPDPETFPGRVPYATYALNWFGDGSQFGNVDESFNALHAHFIGAEGSNLSLSFGPDHHTFELEGEIRDGAEVRLVARGSDTIGEDAIRWNLDVKVPIRLARPTE